MVLGELIHLTEEEKKIIENKLNKINERVENRIGRNFIFHLEKQIFENYFGNRIRSGKIFLNEIYGLVDWFFSENNEIKNKILERIKKSKNLKFFKLIPYKNPKKKTFGDVKLISEKYNVVSVNIRKGDLFEIKNFIEQNFFYSDFTGVNFTLKIVFPTDVKNLKNLIIRYNLDFDEKEFVKILKKVFGEFLIKNQEFRNGEFILKEVPVYNDKIFSEYLGRIFLNGEEWKKEFGLKVKKSVIENLDKYIRAEFNSMSVYAIKEILDLLLLNENISPKIKFQIFDWIVENDDYDRYIESYKLLPEKYKDFALPGAKLYEHQKYCIEVSVNKIFKNKSVLIADPMGAGKTLEALGVIYSLPSMDRGLIVCPAIMKYEWKKSLENFLKVNPNDIAILESSPDRYKKLPLSEVKNRKFLIINYDILQKWSKFLITQQFDFVIFDEAHYLKNESSKRTKAAHAISKKIPVKILLTGTPLMNRIEELWSILKLTETEHIFAQNKTEFMKKYSYLEYFRVGNRKIPRSKGIKNASELVYKLRKELMIRRPKKKILKFLPDKRIIQFYVEFSPKETEKYLKVFLYNTDPITFLNEKLARTKSEYIKRKIRNILEIKDPFEMMERVITEFPEMVLTLYSKLYSLVGELKVPYVIEFVKEIFVGKVLEEDPNSKIVIFAHHKEVQKKIFEELQRNTNLKPLRITAEMNSEERNKVVEQFQNSDESKILVASLGAAKEGLTLTRANVMLFAELWWNPQDLSQAEDRIHRISQNKDVEIYYLISQLEPNTVNKLLPPDDTRKNLRTFSKSIDEIIWELIQEKKDVFEKVTT